MKKSYSFCTDEKLRVTSWGARISGLTGKSYSEAIGRKYYDLLSRFYIGEKDAVGAAIKENRTVNLKGFCCRCVYGHAEADVRILPSAGTKGAVDGAKVMISPRPACSVARRLSTSKQLIDIGKIASTLAHGVRNPLNAIKGVVVYLGEKYSNEPSLIEFTNIMEEEIARLENFISHFLSTSLSESVMSEADVNTLLRKIEVITALQASVFHIRAVYRYGEVPTLMINPFQLEHAILNIINNSIEAMNTGGQLTVTTGIENTVNGTYVVIEISDTGPGMAGSVSNFQLKPSSAGGKGFGMFITNEIVQCHGGHMEIRSESKVGTSVKLYLPVATKEKIKHG